MNHFGRARRAVHLVAPFLVFLFLATARAGESLPHADPAEVGMSAERLDRLTESLQAYVDEGQLPGAVVTVARQGRIAYQQAFGMRDIEAAAPMHTDTIFRIASQTKAIISVGIVMLQEDGALVISDPVSQYLPEFRETTVAVENDQEGYDLSLIHI